MSIKLGDNIEITGPQPNDARYLNVNVPWASTGETNAALLGGVGGVRYTGLTVNIAGTEYWYKNGIEDADLIEKESGGGTLNMSGSTVGGLTTYVDANTVCAQPYLQWDGSILQVSGNTTESRAIQIGHGRTDSGFAYVDLVGDTTYTDYGFRMVRSNSGENAVSIICHRGTGDFRIDTPEGGDIKLRDANTTRLSTTSTGIDICGELVVVNNGISANTIQLTTGAATGCVLTSDASGNATWTTPSGSLISGYTCAVNQVVSIGDNALPYDTNGDCNIAIGENALSGGTGFGDRNIAIGVNAIKFGNGQVANVAIGNNALGGTNVGGANVVIGDGAMDATTSAAASSNVVIGQGAMGAATAGAGNVIIGQNANAACCSSSSVAIGQNAMAEGDGTYNNAIGNSAMCFVSGLDNNGFGYLSMRDLTTGNGNVGMGTRVAYRNTTGDYNVVLGYYAGCSFTGSSNVMIGYCAGANETTTSNCLIIGNSSTNCLIHGDFSTNKVTVCCLQITAGAGAGCVLQSDGSGNASWATSSGGATDLSIGSSTGTVVRVDSSTGTNATLPLASATVAGVVSNTNQTFAGAKCTSIFWGSTCLRGALIYSEGLICAVSCVRGSVACGVTSVDTPLVNTTTTCQAGNINFCQGATRCITVATATDGGIGDELHICAGGGDSDTSPGTGGNTRIYGGDAGGHTGGSGGVEGGAALLYGGVGGCSNGTFISGGNGGTVHLRGGQGGTAAGGIGGIGGITYVCGGPAGPSGSIGTGKGGHVCIKGGNGSPDGCVFIYNDTALKLSTTSYGTLTTGTHCANTSLCTPLICVNGSAGVHLNVSAACGSAIDWIATSDCRIKKNIEPITSALSKVDALCGVCYELCEDGTPDMGLIAQEVICVEPRLVACNEVSEEYKKYGIEDQMLGLKYDKFAGLFVEAIKELKQQNECLQLQINELRKNN